MGEESEELRHYVDRASRGDLDAWEWLYRRAYPMLFGFARRRLGDETTADDVVSETMMRALDKLATFEWRGAGFDGWLFGICRNVLFETYRSAGRVLPLETVPEIPGTDDDPATHVMKSVDRQLLLTAFARLDPDEQEILELRVVADLSSEAVGEVLGKNPGAVRMAQSRALGRLRTFVEEVNRGQ